MTIGSGGEAIAAGFEDGVDLLMGDDERQGKLLRQLGSRDLLQDHQAWGGEHPDCAGSPGAQDRRTCK